MSSNASTRVLVIDDEAPIRLLCRVNLEAKGMDVLEAADGPTGLEKARAETPDVVLLDVMMPGLDGWRVAEELLDDPRTESIPIVFLTARAELRDRARGIDLGGIDYVTKPFNPVELAPLVRAFARARRRGERRRGSGTRSYPSCVRCSNVTPRTTDSAAGEVGGDDMVAPLVAENTRRRGLPIPNPGEPRTEKVCAVLRAREPGADDRARVPNRPFPQARFSPVNLPLTSNCTMRMPNAPCFENAGGKHLPRMRASGLLERAGRTSGINPCADAHEVQVTEEPRLGAGQAGGRRWRRNEHEQGRDECREPRQHAEGSLGGRRTHRADCARPTATSTTAAPASCTASSDSLSQSQPTSAPTTGSSIATIPAVVALTCRSALTSRKNGTIVPRTNHPRRE